MSTLVTASAVEAFFSYQPPGECDYVAQPGDSVTVTLQVELTSAELSQVSTFGVQDLKPSAFITKEVGQASIQVRNLFVPIILNISPTSIPDVYPYSIQIDLYDAGSNLLRGVQFDGCVLVEVETVDPKSRTVVVPEWSKRSCGLSKVEPQQPSQAFTAADLP